MTNWLGIARTGESAYWHQNLADAMQIQSAKVILNVAVKALRTKKIWYASIHNPVICRLGDQEEVAALMLDAF